MKCWAVSASIEIASFFLLLLPGRLLAGNYDCFQCDLSGEDEDQAECPRNASCQAIKNRITPAWDTIDYCYKEVFTINGKRQIHKGCVDELFPLSGDIGRPLTGCSYKTLERDTGNVLAWSCVCKGNFCNAAASMRSSLRVGPIYFLVSFGALAVLSQCLMQLLAL